MLNSFSRTELIFGKDAMKNRLPDKILWRKKSPYPKTHSPEYRETVPRMVCARPDKKESFRRSLIARCLMRSCRARIKQGSGN